MPFDLHQTFQDFMKEKAEVMCGYKVLAGRPESRTHIQVDYYCEVDLNEPYTGPEGGVRPLDNFKRHNVIELEGLGRTLDEGRFRYHVGRALVMENPSGKTSRCGQTALTILVVHKPVKLLNLEDYDFRQVTPWKIETTAFKHLPVTIILLRELQKVKGGEAMAWLQLLEPEPKRRTQAWTTILDQELTGRERLKRVMMDMDKEAFMTVAEEFRIEGRMEGRKEGQLEGEKRGRYLMLQSLLNKGLITEEDYRREAALLERGNN